MPRVAMPIVMEFAKPLICFGSIKGNTENNKRFKKAFTYEAEEPGSE